MEIQQTHRGFALITFIDHYGLECSLQKSSLATEEAIWFGVSNPKPQIMARELDPNATGWVDYPVPDEVLIQSRMHLTQEQVAELLPYLQCFIRTGEFYNE